MDESADAPIEAAWERIENWLADNAPFTLLTLNKGATEKDIWACEAAVGFRLPAEVAESWRIHNGQGEGTLIGDAQLLPLSEVAAAWRNCTANLAFWNPLWLPLTMNEEGDYVCLDLSKHGYPWPEPILFVRQDGKEIPGVLAPNYTDWLIHFAEALETGLYSWSSDYDGLIHAQTRASQMKKDN